ncbi:MAG: hypothetical protein WAN36_03415, partial [Calditrichia bacterium]
ENTLWIAMDANHPNDNTESLNVGAEYAFRELIYLRGGYRQLLMEDLEGGLVLGAGLEIGYAAYSLKFDYGWADYGILEQTHRFTLGIGF